jgi:formate dehydrogenase subunit delta
MSDQTSDHGQDFAAKLVEKHVRMANQIAAFFRSYPAEEAAAGIRDHIVSFWTPNMRRIVLDHREAGGEGLDPLVVTALESVPRAKSPIRRETAGPDAVGEMASDAG